jgi:predicted RNA-binding protein with PIN domain
LNLVVDGYNIINSWKYFQKKILDLEEKRNKLIDILLQFQNLSGNKIVLVFDGKSNKLKKENFLGLEIIYTSNKESADTLIEKMVKESENASNIRVITSDRNLKLFTFGMGALNQSPKDFEREINTIFKINKINLLN